jgi:nitroreductase
MDFMEIIKGRRSIRKYLPTEVEDEKVKQILESGQWAPSASNKQPWHFIVVRNEETRRLLADAHAYGRFLITIVLCARFLLDIMMSNQQEQENPLRTLYRTRRLSESEIYEGGI